MAKPQTCYVANKMLIILRYFASPKPVLLAEFKPK